MLCGKGTVSEIAAGSDTAFYIFFLPFFSLCLLNPGPDNSGGGLPPSARLIAWSLSLSVNTLCLSGGCHNAQIIMNKIVPSPIINLGVFPRCKNTNDSVMVPIAMPNRHMYLLFMVTDITPCIYSEGIELAAAKGLCVPSIIRNPKSIFSLIASDEA